MFIYIFLRLDTLLSTAIFYCVILLFVFGQKCRSFYRIMSFFAMVTQWGLNATIRILLGLLHNYTNGIEGLLSRLIFFVTSA